MPLRTRSHIVAIYVNMNWLFPRNFRNRPSLNEKSPLSAVYDKRGWRVPGRTCTDKPARRRLPEPLCLLFHHRDMDGRGRELPGLSYPPNGGCERHRSHDLPCRPEASYSAKAVPSGASFASGTEAAAGRDRDASRRCLPTAGAPTSLRLRYWISVQTAACSSGFMSDGSKTASSW
jgi:hypothetical protein